MIQRPNAVCLWVCEDVLVEEGTKSLTLMRGFSRLRFSSFPSPPVNFTVCAALRDGLGPVTLALVCFMLTHSTRFTSGPFVSLYVTR
jgi:hypothetical protein